MSITILRRAAFALGLATALGVASTSAVAQSDRQLRRENEVLRSENEQLRAQVESLTNQIKELQTRCDWLEQQLRQQATGAVPTAPGTPAAPERVSIDETQPDASPRALLRALTSSYEESLADVAIGDDPQGKERKIYLRELSRWMRRVNRDFKSQIEWHVKVLDGRQRPGEYELDVVAVDPVHGTELGHTFEVILSRGIARHVEQLQARGELDTLVLRGALQPAVRLNPDRQDAGPFNNPPLLGPFAEFGLGVIATSMVTPEEIEPETPRDAGGSAP